MESPFPFSDDNKRYHTYAYFLKRRYGGRVARVPLDGGFSCPNRDGTKGAGGCAFCSGRGSGDQIPALPSLREQYAAGRAKLAEKWPDARYIPYLQAFSGTYAPIRRLCAVYEEALRLPGAVGLAVATRADCVTEDAAELLAEIAARTDLTVELGLQTASDETARRIGRCETRAEFLEGFARLRARKVPVWVHLINGLPGETPEDMRASAQFVAGLGVQGIKMHLLHVLRGTPLASAYLEGQLPVLLREDYVSVVCDQLELLPPSMVIGRLTGDGAAAELLAPLWSRRKREVLNAIDRELVRRDSWQGKRYCRTK
ncbi:MAG: TIGR01212 family radical SAM protein [Intestinibacillus sp.]